MEVLKFIQENYLILVVVLGVLGYGLKQAAFIQDKYIPIILIALGGILGAVMSTQTDFTLFDGVLQGIICGGASVGVNQVPKQLKK